MQKAAGFAMRYVIEDLSVKNMMKNHCLAGSIGDAAWGKFFQFLSYKCEWYGKNLLSIGRFEPSSKMCNKCGHINKSLQLKEREWTCECGSANDRDVNAAQNIKSFGLHRQNIVGSGSSQSNARGVCLSRGD